MREREREGERARAREREGERETEREDGYTDTTKIQRVKSTNLENTSFYVSTCQRAGCLNMAMSCYVHDFMRKPRGLHCVEVAASP